MVIGRLVWDCLEIDNIKLGIVLTIWEHLIKCGPEGWQASFLFGVIRSLLVSGFGLFEGDLRNIETVFAITISHRESDV